MSNASRRPPDGKQGARHAFSLSLTQMTAVPRTLGPQLQRRLERELGNNAGAAVLAVREYENWLLADAAALGQDSAFRDRINPPGNPETVEDAKRWLSARRTDRRSYRPTIDQAPLTELVDLPVVRERCPSFDKFWREVERLATS